MQKKIIVVSFDQNLRNMDTFADFARWWYLNHQDRVSGATYEGYRYTLDKLIETFGEWKLRDIQPYHIEVFLDAAYDSNLSRSYVSKLRAMLYQIFRKAEANSLVEKNPVPLAEPVRMPAEYVENILDQQKDAFTQEEVRLLLARLPRDKIGSAIRIMLGSGARLQEMLGFEQQHAAPDGSYLCIRQAVKVVRGVASIGPPKTLGSYRDLPIPDVVKESVVYLINQNQKFLVPGGCAEKPYNPKSFRDIYYRYLDMCGVRRLPPHSCRHTYVSQMQAAGVDVETIKYLVGHSRVKMTEHYLHVQSEARVEAVAKLNSLYS